MGCRILRGVGGAGVPEQTRSSWFRLTALPVTATMRLVRARARGNGLQRSQRIGVQQGAVLPAAPRAWETRAASAPSANAANEIVPSRSASSATTRAEARASACRGEAGDGRRRRPRRLAGSNQLVHCPGLGHRSPSAAHGANHIVIEKMTWSDDLAGFRPLRHQQHIAGPAAGGRRGCFSPMPISPPMARRPESPPYRLGASLEGVVGDVNRVGQRRGDLPLIGPLALSRSPPQPNTQPACQGRTGEGLSAATRIGIVGVFAAARPEQGP